MFRFSFKSYALILSIMTLALSGCNKDNSGKDTAEKSGIITFRMTTPELRIYTKSGEIHENGTTSDKFAFYQFNKDGAYERTYTTDYSAMRPDGGNSLVYDLVTGKLTGPKKIVIIRSSNAEVFPKLGLGDNLRTLMETKTVSADGGFVYPEIMSSMSDADTGESESQAAIDVTAEQAAKGNVEVQMPRNICRIDILNDTGTTGLEIEKVYVKNARSTGHIAYSETPTSDIYSSTLEIQAGALANGKSFYLYPTVLTQDKEQNEKTAIWATTKIAGKNEVGPEINLFLEADVKLKPNFIYEMKVTAQAGSEEGGFELNEQEWTDGSQSDWLPAGSGIILPNDKAVIFEGTDIKGTYIKVGPEASLPYKITKTVIDNNPADIEMSSDNDFPFWLNVKSSTAKVGENTYKHDVVFTVSDPSPGDETRFAITYPKGSTDDTDIISFGFIDPYPGTPLPCLSWGKFFYSPTHAGQTGYLKRNMEDKAYYAGQTGYTLDSKGPFINDIQASPCPEGWRVITDSEAKEFLDWVGGNLKNKMGQGIYTYNLFGNPIEATNVRIHAGYARSAGDSPEMKDLACYGSWPNSVWLQIDDSNLTVISAEYNWTIDKDYALPYRCIREK